MIILKDSSPIAVEQELTARRVDSGIVLDNSVQVAH
jgi:hypothetical protein